MRQLKPSQVSGDGLEDDWEIPLFDMCSQMFQDDDEFYFPN